MLQVCGSCCQPVQAGQAVQQLLANHIQSHWDDDPPCWGVKDKHHKTAENQEKIGSVQIFFGTFSQLWSRVHDRELASASVSKAKHNTGAAWARSVIKTIWKHVCKMWTARNKDRHGHDEAEQRELVRQRNLREISMWYDYRDAEKFQCGMIIEMQVN